MDYRLEHTERKTFIALNRSFSNFVATEPGNHDIADFWDEPETRRLVDRLRDLRPDGKKDLYGLCSPNTGDHFDYGIGILADSDTAYFDADVLLQEGYSLWTVEPGTFVVLDCFGETGDSIEEMWERFYKEFLPQMGYKAAQKTDFEIYFEKGRPGLFCELWIPVEK